MALRAQIRYTGGPGVLKKDLRAAAKASLAVVGATWHDKTLPGHFTPAAAGRYKYRKRTAKYRDRKRRVHGHRRPLVYSGEMERMVTRMARVTATGRGARVALKGPRYLYAYRKAGQPDKAAELIAVTPAEAEDMATVLDREITARLNANKTTETHTIG